jgi:multidrug efflux pump subunit AcrB
MNPGVYSVNHSRIIFALTFIVLVGGVFAYQNLGRLEDPEFTIKQALIVTPYPGASPEEVAREVTNPIESACQQMGQVDRVESESTRGRSLVRVHIKDQYHKDRIPQVWDELRRKVNDVQSRLPPSVRGTSQVVDDFGDVYGIFMAITGKGFSQPELRRYADATRRELQLVSGVAKVDLFNEQQEVVFLEMSRPRLARLGINENQIYAQLQAKNVVADGGRVRVGGQYVVIDPTGGFRSAEDMLDLVIGSDSSGHQLLLRDVATIERSYEDPPRRLFRYDSQPAIGIGISTVPGGNVVTMGDGVLKKLAEMKSNQPIGIEFHDVNFQPTAVTEATKGFTFNLIKATTIVFVVLLFAMGRKAGFIIGFVLFLTIMGTFLVMYMKGDLLMERISLGALIIALCMLTDNAIVVTEGFKIGIEAGKDKLQVIRDVIAQNQWPLFGATGIAVLAFAAIGLSEDSSGELLSSLFWVIFISLTLSWVAAITVTPLLAYLFLKPSADGHSLEHAYDGQFFQTYRRFLALALRFRYTVLAATILLFFATLYGFTKLDQSFFPPATRPQFMVDTFLPAGTHIRVSEEYAGEVERYLLAQPGIKHVSSFVGGGALRFLLVYSAEQPNTGYVQFLVEVDDWRKIDELVPKVQKYLEAHYPNANTNTRKFQLGPGSNGRVQVRFSGPDPATLRALAGQAQSIIEDSGEAVGVRSDWRQPEKVIRPKVLELQAHRNGLTRVDVAQALESGFPGRVVGFYREPGGAGTGVFPQEARLLPIIARPPLAERNDVDEINNLQIWSPVAGRMIPMSQVVSGVEVEWENPIVMRRDRMSTVTVLADGRGVLPSHLLNSVRQKIEQIKLPSGYLREWGGEYEDSNNARESLARQLPAAVLGMVFIVVCLFNSMRATAVICLAVPLALIGAVAGLLITSNPFGFMSLLGLLALGGEQVKNSVVLVEEIFLQIHEGKEPYAAVLQAGIHRLRPVLLVVVTSVLGMIPLLLDPFFSGMAAVIMFGLAFAAVLTMIVVPVLYAIFFRVPTPDAGFTEAPRTV